MKKILFAVLAALAVVSPAVAASPWFILFNEITGDAGAAAQSNLTAGLMNGIDFHTVLSTGEQTFLSNNPGLPFFYFSIPSSAGVSSCYPNSTDANTFTLLNGYAAGRSTWQFGMPEFDQNGGCWAASKPNYSGLTDSAAHTAWLNYYNTTLGLAAAIGAGGRNFAWASNSVYEFTAQYAYEMGVSLEMIERNEDEITGMTPGLAFIRGASTQNNGASWGIDFATYRYWSNGPTVYSGPPAKLVTGWSTSTFKRNFYMAFMGGENVMHMEASDLTTGHDNGQTYNPLGLTLQNFANFALTRHSARGTPYVPMAIMQDHYSGFESASGMYTQAPYKWYFNNPYLPSDRMLENTLNLVFPNHSSWGVVPTPPIVRNADNSINEASSFAAYQSALASSTDPRPWEGFGSGRWGETFDVVTNQIALTPLSKYKAVMLTTGVPVSDPLLSTLTQYVQQGGILILNALQLSANAQGLAGVNLSGRASAANETWTPGCCTTTINESPYNYTVVTPTSATVISATGGHPVITKNKYGAGTVYVTTPDYLADASAVKILNVGQTLLSYLQSQFSVATVNGPQSDYLITIDGNNTIVTLINTDTTGAPWNGTISFQVPPAPYSVHEWIGDTAVSSSVINGQVVIGATVNPYDVAVYALTTP